MIHLFFDPRKRYYQACSITSAGCIYGGFSPDTHQTFKSLADNLKAGYPSQSAVTSVPLRLEAYLAADSNRPLLTLLASAPDILTFMSTYPEYFL